MPHAVRMATPSDAAAIHAIYAPYVRDTAISFEYEVPSVDEMRVRIQKVLGMYPWLVCEVDGAIAGYAYASRFHPRAAFQWAVETSVYVAPPAQRRGVARALYAALFEMLRAQGVLIAVAAITLPHPASVALHEGLGFRPVREHPNIGFKHGQWRGVGWWQLELAPLPAAPLPPVPAHTLG